MSESLIVNLPEEILIYICLFNTHKLKFIFLTFPQICKKFCNVIFSNQQNHYNNFLYHQLLKEYFYLQNLNIKEILPKNFKSLQYFTTQNSFKERFDFCKKEYGLPIFNFHKCLIHENFYILKKEKLLQQIISQLNKEKLDSLFFNKFGKTIIFDNKSPNNEVGVAILNKPLLFKTGIYYLEFKINNFNKNVNNNFIIGYCIFNNLNIVNQLNPKQLKKLKKKLNISIYLNKTKNNLKKTKNNLKNNLNTLYSDIITKKDETIINSLKENTKRFQRLKYHYEYNSFLSHRFPNIPQEYEVPLYLNLKTNLDSNYFGTMYSKNSFGYNLARHENLKINIPLFPKSKQESNNNNNDENSDNKELRAGICLDTNEMKVVWIVNDVVKFGLDLNKFFHLNFESYFTKELALHFAVSMDKRLNSCTIVDYHSIEKLERIKELMKSNEIYKIL